MITNVREELSKYLSKYPGCNTTHDLHMAAPTYMELCEEIYRDIYAGDFTGFKDTKPFEGFDIVLSIYATSGYEMKPKERC